MQMQIIITLKTIYNRKNIFFFEQNNRKNIISEFGYGDHNPGIKVHNHCHWYYRQIKSCKESNIY